MSWKLSAILRCACVQSAKALFISSRRAAQSSASASRDAFLDGELTSSSILPSLNSGMSERTSPRTCDAFEHRVTCSALIFSQTVSLSLIRTELRTVFFALRKIIRDSSRFYCQGRSEAIVPAAMDPLRGRDYSATTTFGMFRFEN